MCKLNGLASLGIVAVQIKARLERGKIKPGQRRVRASSLESGFRGFGAWLDSFPGGYSTVQSGSLSHPGLSPGLSARIVGMRYCELFGDEAV
jgi:hypothetical protein